MKLFSISFLFFFLLTENSFSQEEIYFSTHKSHKEYFDSLALNHPLEFEKLTKTNKIEKIKGSKECNLEKIVFGWHPYWLNGSEDNYQWNLLSDLSYFSYEVDYLTGDALTTRNWETAPVIDDAQANGVRVNLCVTLFDNHEAFFANAAAQQNLIDNLLTTVQARNANGVNLDIESIPASEAENLNNFLVNLADQFHNEDPNFQVSIALHAVDWSDIYDIDVLKDHIDLFIIMGYGYYWSSSSYAGPTGQLYTMYNFNYNQSRSITYYLSEGVPKEKLLLGVPYYGYNWPTADNNVPASATGSASVVTIKTLKNNTYGYYSNSSIDENSLCTYYNYNSGSPHQAWVDAEETMQFKYDVVMQRDIAGIGIWALGYDDGYTEMWDLIENNFTDCAVVPSNYNFYDMGGPTRNHYNREDYTYTIAPTDYIDYLALNFSSFSLEAGFDSLWIYDGSDTNAPLIGGYSGTTGPGFIEASGGAITIKFHSDGATTEQGWNAEWSCSHVSIKDFNENTIKVFPNPTDEFIQISEQAENIQLFTLNGNLLLSAKNINNLDVSKLSSGIYILEIKNHSEIFVKKIIIQH